MTWPFSRRVRPAARHGAADTDIAFYDEPESFPIMNMALATVIEAFLTEAREYAGALKKNGETFTVTVPEEDRERVRHCRELIGPIAMQAQKYSLRSESSQNWDFTFTWLGPSARAAKHLMETEHSPASR